MNDVAVYKSLEALSLHVADLIKANIELQGKISCLDDQIKYLKNRVFILEINRVDTLKEDC